MAGGRHGTHGLAALLACLALAGCSGDTRTPDASVAPVTHSAQVPAVTVTPPALNLGQPTADSAVAFVRYFIDAYNYAYATYDTSLLEDISQPSCKYCASTAKEVHHLADAHLRVDGYGVTLVDAFPATKDIIDSAFVVAVLNQRPGTTTSSEGKLVTYPGSKNSQLGFQLDWDGGKWLVRGVRIQNKGTPWPG